MKFITPKTQLESDLDEKDESILRCAQAANNLAAVLHNENDRFWSLPTDRLLAVLNANVPVTLATFEANTLAGTAINNILDQLADPTLTQRAPVTPGRTDIQFVDGAFVYVPPSEPAPE